MFEILIIIYLVGFMSFLDALFNKWNVYDKIHKKGSQSNSMFVYRLASCLFCVRFHLCWILSIVFVLFYNRTFALIMIPFVVSGFINLFKK